ncbi:hypothetical protein BDN72DRAFT_831551 [Pluteus cervinus]|uniref:Uncharacterized protein n=1 Tax=Pluteus cervinus TaxID=181527 RepID=A0ACD3BE25_9AGAR|nr:hypothetical protein BDN72DRAFT_831551 [Pluteus cervinus]
MSETEATVASTATSYDPLLDPSTFVFPQPLSTPTLVIEFCDRCHWMHRANWLQLELFQTFPPQVLGCISLYPRNSDDTAGRFRVWLVGSDDTRHLVWDRKVEGGFPELKNLKQRIRDIIQPGRSLGHSDKKT